MALTAHKPLSLSPACPARCSACAIHGMSKRILQLTRTNQSCSHPTLLALQSASLTSSCSLFSAARQTCSSGRSCRLGHSTSGIRDPASHTCAGLKVMICFISHGNRWQSFRPHTDMPTPKTDPPTSSSPLPRALRFMFSCKQNNGHASGLGLKESKGERSVS